MPNWLFTASTILLRRVEVHVAQFHLHRAARLRDGVRHRALDDRAARDAPDRKLVHLHLAAVRARARAADHELPCAIA